MKNLITEQFLSLQGEGRSIGKPAYFIRFAGCNLWCRWCDSMHSVDPQLYLGKTGPIDCEKIPDHCNLIILTGGEPTLFDLSEVRSRLLVGNPKRIFEVESNATIFPENIVDNFVWNLSPKLKSSEQKNEILEKSRLQKISVWAEYAKNRDNVSFKFVLTDPNDLQEVEQLIKENQILPNMVYLMAEGQSRESQQLQKVEWIIEACKNKGFNFSPRLHILFWGDQRGV